MQLPHSGSQSVNYLQVIIFALHCPRNMTLQYTQPLNETITYYFVIIFTLDPDCYETYLHYLTFRRVQLSLYTWAYFNPGTFRLGPFSARSRSSANSFSIVFQPNRWLFRVKSLAPCGLELYRAAIVFFSHKMFRRKQK